MSKRWIGNGLLLLGAMIWGAAFVAQSVGMDYLEPFTFQASRCFLGSLVLLPVIAVMDRRGVSRRPVTAEAKKQQLFCKRGLTRIRVRNNGKCSASFDFSLDSLLGHV